MTAYRSNLDFTDKVSSWIVVLVNFTLVKSLKWRTMTWAYQMRAFVSFTENCRTNTGCSDWSWSTETESLGLLSVYFLMDPGLFTFVLYCLLLDVPKINHAQRGNSDFKSRNLDERTPSFDNIKMNLGWR